MGLRAGFFAPLADTRDLGLTVALEDIAEVDLAAKLRQILEHLDRAGETLAALHVCHGLDVLLSNGSFARNADQLGERNYGQGSNRKRSERKPQFPFHPGSSETH